MLFGDASGTAPVELTFPSASGSVKIARLNLNQARREALEHPRELILPTRGQGHYLQAMG